MSRNRFDSRLHDLERLAPTPDAPDLTCLLDHELARLEAIYEAHSGTGDGELPPEAHEEISAIMRTAKRLARERTQNEIDTRTDAEIEADTLAAAQRMERERAFTSVRRVAAGLPALPA
jgi:hypothetical protein